MRSNLILSYVVAASLLVASCAGTSPSGDGDATAIEPTTGDVAAVSERVDAIGDAVSIWRDAESISVAHAAAETALNLVVGPNGPGYGDPDGDGVENGATAEGLLPGLDGTPAGLAIALSANDCVVQDVLGGSWADPPMRWSEMLDAIDDWRPNNNTMPTLASHPMRVVGWATFTLNSDSLEAAHEYAGHANLHVNISRRALEC